MRKNTPLYAWPCEDVYSWLQIRSMLSICCWGFLLACLTSKARPWVPGGAMPAAEHFVLSGVEGAAGAQAPWLLVTAASLGLHLLLFQSRGMCLPENQVFPELWSWLLSAEHGKEQGLHSLYLCRGRCRVADAVSQEDFDGACTNVGTFHEISPRDRHPCTPSSHPLCFLILSCSLCC